MANMKKTETYIDTKEVVRDHAYREDTCMQSAVRDVLTDIRHMCDEGGYDFEKALSGSEEVYNEEKDLYDHGK